MAGTDRQPSSATGRSSQHDRDDGTVPLVGEVADGNAGQSCLVEHDRREYAEGVFVGYRHYDTHGVEPRWCFGPGETTTVSLTLDRRSFAHWDTGRHAWSAAPGRYEIQVGSSSRVIHQTALWTLADEG